MSNVTSLYGDNSLWDSAANNWRKTKTHGDSYFASWLALGRDLLTLRKSYPSNTAFGEAVRAHGIDITSEHQSDAMWLASLDDGALETGREEFPSSLHPHSLRNKMREAFGVDFGIPSSFRPEGGTAPTSESTTPAEAESTTCSEIDGTNSADFDSSEENEVTDVDGAEDDAGDVEEPVGQTISLRRIKAGRPTALFTALGAKHQEDARILDSYCRTDPKAAGLVGLIAKIAKQKGGLVAVRRMADAVRHGAYGDRAQSGNIASLGAHIFLPNLPEKWCRDQAPAKPTPAGLNKLLDMLPKAAELQEAVVRDNPPDPLEYCRKWWTNNVVLSKMSTTQKPPATNVLNLSNYNGGDADAHHGPTIDDDIFVCGVVIYHKGTAKDADEYRRIWATFKLLWQISLGLREEDIAERGREFKRMARAQRIICPISAEILHRSGEAMERAPTLWETETKAAHGII